MITELCIYQLVKLNITLFNTTFSKVFISTKVKISLHDIVSDYKCLHCQGQNCQVVPHLNKFKVNVADLCCYLRESGRGGEAEGIQLHDLTPGSIPESY